MGILHIVAQSVEEANRGSKIVNKKINKIVEFEEATIGILEKGTQQGRVSMSITMVDDEGTAYVVQFTAAQFEMVIGAVRGAVARFER